MSYPFSAPIRVGKFLEYCLNDHDYKRYRQCTDVLECRGEYAKLRLDAKKLGCFFRITYKGFTFSDIIESIGVLEDGYHVVGSRVEFFVRCN